MAALIFAPRVADDLRTIGDWIAQDNPERAVTFLTELHDSCTGLTTFPLSYPSFPRLGPSARRRNYGAYAILYDVTEDTVTILAVVHGARDLATLEI